MLRGARGADHQILRPRAEIVLLALCLAAYLGWLQTRTPYLIGLSSYVQGYQAQVLLGRRQPAPAVADLHRHRPQRLTQIVTAAALRLAPDETRGVKAAAWAMGLAALLAVWALLRALGVRGAWLYIALLLAAGERFLLELLAASPDVLNLALLAALARSLLGRRRWSVVVWATLLGWNTSWAPILTLGLWAATRWARPGGAQRAMLGSALLPAALAILVSGPHVLANVIGIGVQIEALARAWLQPLSCWTIEEFDPIEIRALLLGPGALWCLLAGALGLAVAGRLPTAQRAPALAALGALVLATLRVSLEARGFIFLVPAAACLAALVFDGLDARLRRWALAAVGLCVLAGGAGTWSHVLPRLGGLLNGPEPYIEGIRWLEQRSERGAVVLATGLGEAEVLGFLSGHNRLVTLGHPAALAAASPERANAWQGLRRGQVARMAALCNDVFDADWLFADKTRIEMHRRVQNDIYLLQGWQAREFGIYRAARQKPR